MRYRTVKTFALVSELPEPGLEDPLDPRTVAEPGKHKDRALLRGGGGGLVDAVRAGVAQRAFGASSEFWWSSEPRSIALLPHETSLKATRTNAPLTRVLRTGCSPIVVCCDNRVRRPNAPAPGPSTYSMVPGPTDDRKARRRAPVNPGQ